MIEILNIIYLSILTPLIALLPVSYFKTKKEISTNIGSSVLNYLFILNIILIVSFFDIKISTYLNFLLLILLILFITFYKNITINYLYSVSFFFILLFIILIDISDQLILYWDAQKIWLPKTIVFYNEEDIQNLSELSRPNYPYFGSLYWAIFWKISYLNHEYIGRIGYVFLFLLALGNFANSFQTGKKTKIFFYFFFLYIIYDYWHFRGTQEILIFSLILISAISIFNIKKKFDKFDFPNLLIFLLSINLIIWTKNEGIFFSFFLLISLLLKIYKNYRLKLYIFFFFVFLILIRFLIFKYYNFSISLSGDFNYLFLYQDFQKNFSLNNIYFITKHIFFTSFKFISILISFLFLILLFKKKNFFSKNKDLLIVPILNMIFIYSIYLTTNKDFEHMVITSLNRVFFESSSYFLIYILIYFNDLKKKL
jgi:hypothetical protein